MGQAAGPSSRSGLTAWAGRPEGRWAGARRTVLSAFAPASIARAESKPIRGQAASKMPSTTTVLRRKSSLRRSAGTGGDPGAAAGSAIPLLASGATEGDQHVARSGRGGEAYRPGVGRVERVVADREPVALQPVD